MSWDVNNKTMSVFSQKKKMFFGSRKIDKNFALNFISLHYPMSIRSIYPVCPQAILAMGMTLFPSGMLCVTNIPSINCTNTIFCSKLNGEHTGEMFMSLRCIVFRYTHVKLKNCRFREDVSFDLS